jgi:hypothetical protein
MGINDYFFLCDKQMSTIVSVCWMEQLRRSQSLQKDRKNKEILDEK